MYLLFYRRLVVFVDTQLLCSNYIFILFVTCLRMFQGHFKGIRLMSRNIILSPKAMPNTWCKSDSMFTILNGFNFSSLEENRSKILKGLESVDDIAYHSCLWEEYLNSGMNISCCYTNNLFNIQKKTPRKRIV